MSRAWVGLVVVALGGCLASPQAPCADGVICPENLVCAPAGGSCVEPAQVAACDGRAEGAACELAGIGAGACRLGLCVVAGCGDQILDAGEECDDGNQVPDDGCTNACTLARCGDQVVQPGEACDDGAANGDDRACTTTCAQAVCGDNLVLAGAEECDAGAANADGAVCTSLCLRNVCGDGKTFAGVEACDDGNTAGGDGCRGDCGKVEACGDAVVDDGEACDDGNGNLADGCAACARTTWVATAVLGGDVAATQIGLSSPNGLAIDLAGNLYLADTFNHRVRRFDRATGSITTIAGTGEYGFGGDGGLATSAQLASPLGVAVDGTGTVYVADTDNHRVRRIDPAGVITTLAGTGVDGSAGDNGPGTSAQLDAPAGLVVDGLGNVFVSDFKANRIRRIAGDTGVITAFAGTGTAGATGDGGSAVSARLRSPDGLALGPDGALYVADRDNHKVRRIAAGFISTVVGTGTAGFLGDGGSALAARLASPRGVVVAADGTLFVSDAENQRVRRVDAVSGVISTFAGTGALGFGGDGGPATLASLAYPSGIVVDAVGAVTWIEVENHRVRSVDPVTSVITTIIGSGAIGFVGDGGFATSAPLAAPYGAAVDSTGRLYVADHGSNRIRRIDLTTGIITTVAGRGDEGYSGDGGPAVDALLAGPRGLAIDAQDRLYIADRDNHVIRWIDLATGTIETLAGDGTPGFDGDGGPVAGARFNVPYAIAVGPGGVLYVADRDNHRVRRLDVVQDQVQTVAGTGTPGFAGDNGPAVAAQLHFPQGVAVAPSGALYIADRDNHRVRRVQAGTITTVAGTGVEGAGLDGVAATASALASPVAVTATADALFIGQRRDGRVRRVSLVDQQISTVIGNSVGEFAGDGGAVAQARLNSSRSIVAQGEVLTVVDPIGPVRRIQDGLVHTVAGPVQPEGMGPASLARLADPRAMAQVGELTLVAGGTSGRVQTVDPALVQVIAGRYPNPEAVGDLALYRSVFFGDVGGIAWDADAGVAYVSETTQHRIHTLTPDDPVAPTSWTISLLVGVAGEVGTPGFVDGAIGVARLRTPTGLFVDAAAGVLYVADTGNHVVRALDLVAGTVSTVAGTGATLGFFGDGGSAEEALLFAPRAVTRCASTGDLYVADTGNHRLRRIAAGTGVITTVLGDGIAASSGEGTPAASFPINAPLGVACDDVGNLFATSTTAVRFLPAQIDLGATDGVVDGSGPVQLIYGAEPRDTFPESVTRCLTAVSVRDPSTAWLADACTGLVVELVREPLAP